MLDPETLTRLRRTAADGNAHDLLLLHLLERVESLEARPIPGSYVLVADHVFGATKIAPNTDPLVTEDGLVRCYAQAIEDAVKAGHGIDGADPDATAWSDAIAAARAALAQPEGEGPYDLTRTLLRPAYEPGDGSADGAQLVNLAWWHPVMGCDSLQIVVDNARAALARWGGPSAPPAPEGEHAGGSINDEQREAVRAAVTEALGNAYDCLRVWEAWQVGTMGPDDFALVAEDDDRVAKIADAAIEAMRPATPPAQGPAPDSPAEALAARRLLQEVARLDNSAGITVAEVRQLAAHAAAWLRENPPGQPVAIEPRGCPLPGACSCVVPGARPAPEMGLLVDRLNQVAGDFDFLCNKIVNGECRTLACLQRGGYDDELCRARGIKPPDPLVATCPALEKAGAMRRAATLLQQLSAVPVAVSERLPGEGDCDMEGRCWWFSPPACGAHKIRRRACWTLDSETMEGDTHWRPASAIPLPQAGEVKA
jgi:hypothetical protein